MGGKGKGKGKGKQGPKPTGDDAQFLVKLGGEFKPYQGDEDKILKRAYMAGFPNAKFELRGQHYVYDFKTMKQKNTDSGKERDIKAPKGWKQPGAPIVPPGPTMTVTVPAGAAGQTIQVPHPKIPGQYINVNVPAGAKAGQAMLVPVPATGEAKMEGGGAAAGGGGWSTGAKVAGGAVGVAAVGGLAVGGALLGAAIAEDGADATFAGIGDAAGDFAADAGDWAGDAADAAGDWGADAADAAGDWAGDAAGDVGEWAGDAGDFIIDGADTAGDFIMDLF